MDLLTVVLLFFSMLSCVKPDDFSKPDPPTLTDGNGLVAAESTAVGRSL